METQLIQSKIYTLRGQRVMLDFDLAALYGVQTKVLNQAVKRNIERFPEDFMFQLFVQEWQSLRSQNLTLDVNRSQFMTGSDDLMWSQIVTTSKKYRRDTYIPYVFTEQGVAMLSSVLRNEKAIHVNIAIMRAFVAMRRFALTFAELAEKVAELERNQQADMADVNEVLRWLGEENQSRATEIASLEPNSTSWEKRRAIGFKKED